MRQHMCHRADKALHIWDVEELVRSMSVGKRTKDTSHNELSLRPQTIKEGQKGNRTTFRYGKRLFSEVFLTCRFESLAQQWMVFRCVEALSGICLCHSDLRIVRRIFSQSLNHIFDGLLAIFCGREPYRDLGFGEGKHHISSCDWLRKSVHSSDCQLGPPAIEDQRLKHVRADSLQISNSHELLDAGFSYFSSQVAQLLVSIGWDINIESFYTSRLMILQSLNQASQNSERGRNNS